MRISHQQMLLDSGWTRIGSHHPLGSASLLIRRAHSNGGQACGSRIPGPQRLWLHVPDADVHRFSPTGVVDSISSLQGTGTCTRNRNHNRCHASGGLPRPPLNSSADHRCNAAGGRPTPHTSSGPHRSEARRRRSSRAPTLQTSRSSRAAPWELTVGQRFLAPVQHAITPPASPRMEGVRALSCGCTFAHNATRDCVEPSTRTGPRERGSTRKGNLLVVSQPVRGPESHAYLNHFSQRGEAHCMRPVFWFGRSTVFRNAAY